MPSVQRGSVVKRGKRWAARWYDEGDVRRFQGGFETKSAARTWLADKIDDVAALRRGDVIVPVRERLQTVDELADAFLDGHGRTVDVATKRSLRVFLCIGGWLGVVGDAVSEVDA